MYFFSIRNLCPFYVRFIIGQRICLTDTISPCRLNSRSLLRDVLGSPRPNDFGAFGMHALLSTTRTIVSQQSHRRDGNVQASAIWDGNSSTIIDIKTHSSGSQTVGLQQPPGAEESSSRGAIDSFEMKDLRAV